MSLFNDLFAFIKDDEIGNTHQLAIEDDSGSAGRNKKSDSRIFISHNSLENEISQSSRNTFFAIVMKNENSQ